MTSEERMAIYREIEHDFYMEDAVSQIEAYLGAEGVDSEDFIESFDVDYLADVFAKKHDSNVADNDQWQALIREYIKANEINLHDKRKKQWFEVAFSVEGRFYTRVYATDVNEAKKMAENQYYEADFGILNEVDGNPVHAMSIKDGKYHYFV